MFQKKKYDLVKQGVKLSIWKKLRKSFRYSIKISLNLHTEQGDCLKNPKQSITANGIYQLKKQGMTKIVKALEWIYDDDFSNKQGIQKEIYKLLKA